MNKTADQLPPEPQQPNCSLAIERRGQAVVAQFTGEVILSGPRAEAAGANLTALLAEPGRPAILVDFGNVKSLSSLMLGKLIGLNRAAEAAGTRLALFNLRPDIRGIMEVTKLNLILHIFGDESEALKGL